MAMLKNVEAMAPGVWNGIKFLIEHLRGMASAFKEQRLSGKLPAKLGHHDDSTQPAQGWITDMRVEGERLLVDIDDVPDTLVDEIKAGRWRHVSMELLKDAKRGDQTYPWLPDAIALLGAAQPAVNVLKGLNEIFAHAAPGFTYESKFAFSRENESEADALRKQNTKLQQQLIHAEFETAIASGRVLPRERETFKRRFADAGTVDDARAWIASTPKPAGFSSTQSRHEPQRQTFSRPDEEMVWRTNERIKFEFKESGRRIDYLEASRLVLREDADLAKQYVDMPSTLDR